MNKDIIQNKRKGLNSNNVTIRKPKKPQPKVKKISERVYKSIDLPLCPPVDISFKDNIDNKNLNNIQIEQNIIQPDISHPKETTGQIYEVKNKKLYISLCILATLTILGLLYL